MTTPRTTPRRISAGVILIDRQARVLMQLRDDDPAIMFPGHWGLTGGAANAGETPEQTAAREIEEETGIALERFEPFRAYYFTASGGPKKSASRAEFELYMFHAPCQTPLDEMTCGEGRELRFFSPDEIAPLNVAYNHRDVLADFFASPLYARYALGAAFDDDHHTERVDPLSAFTAEVDAGEPWFDALMHAIALWERAGERVDGRDYRYLIGGEAFDWLLLAERLIAEAPGGIPADEAERLLFAAQPPSPPGEPARAIDDARLRALIGDAKHRAHLNFVYGITVEEALQYAAELELSKERVNVNIRDPRDAEAPSDPVFERIYGRPRADLLTDFRSEKQLRRGETMSLAELREFTYWLFKYRVAHSEPARVASDTRKALAQLSAIEDGARRSTRARARSAEPAAAPVG